MAFHLAIDGYVFDGVYSFAVFFSKEISWVRSGTELSQFLRRDFSYLLNDPNGQENIICTTLM